jgi:ATP-dependent DNA ligase
MKPMCAFKWQDHRAKLTFPFYVQPKLNGVRALYHQGIMQSRGLREEEGKVWNPEVVQHFTQPLALACPPTWILDGELYCHGKSLQQINSAVAVKRKSTSSVTHEIHYHIFDIIDTQCLHRPFHERAELLELLKTQLVIHQATTVQVVHTVCVNNPGLDDELYQSYRSQGYEGLMYRLPLAPYGFAEECGNKENRWKSLLKRKGWIDDEFLILGFELTTGAKGNQGFQLTCQTEQGHEFTVGSGLTVDQQNYYAQNSPEGFLAKVRFEMLSDKGIPLKPTLEAILD